MSFVNTASPKRLQHFYRMERMTMTRVLEESPDWGRGWIGTPSLRRSNGTKSQPWSPSTGRSSTQLKNATLHATSPKQKEKLLQQAALAEKEEKQHEMLQGKIWKTASYCDRNRFRCFGAPMLLQNDRESFRSHSVMSAHLQAEERRHVETPLQDSFHAHEFPLRSHSVLKTHSTKKPVRMFGLRSDKSGETQILSQSIPRPTPNGRVDVVGYGSSTQVVISEEPPEETERSLINETLMANSVRMPFLSDSKRRTRPRTSMSESGGSNENFRPWTSAGPSPAMSAGPSPKRIFMGVRNGSIYDPDAAIRPPSRTDSPYRVLRTRAWSSMN